MAEKLSYVGNQAALFNFSPSKTSTRMSSASLNPPSGATVATIAIQKFNIYYTGKNQYGFGKLEITSHLSSTTSATCEVTLRDNHTNEREWEGTVTGIVTYYG